MVALLSIVGVQQSYAYTISELESAGWTKVTSITDVDNYYYVFIDAGSSNYAMGRLSYGSERPVYMPIADPMGFAGEVWYLGEDNGSYTIKNLGDDKFCISGTAGWNNSMTAQQWGDEGLFTFNVTLPEGKYDIKSVKTGSYVGPWNNDNKVSLSNGYENIAANKDADKAPGFYLYSMPRTEYNAKRITASWLTSHGWSQVTDNSALGNASNYYLIIEKVTFGYAMARTSNGRPASKSLSNPFSTRCELWAIAAKGSGYSLQNVVDNTYFTSAAGDWNTSMSNTPNADIIATVSDGVYTLSAGGTSSIGHWRDDQFFPYENENIAANKNNDNRNSYYIYTISKSDYATQRASYIASLAASATKAAPVDLTSYIFNNSDFATLAKLGWTVSGSWGNQQTGNGAYETWNSNNVSVTQELTDLPGGKYQLSVQMVSGDTGRVPYLYANADAEYTANVTQQATTNTYDGMKDEIAADPSYGLLTVSPNVLDGSLTVGMKAPSGWVVFDNFKLKYYGPTVASTAVALPDGGAMTADTWYKFTPAAGDYNLTTTTLGDIVYATDGSIFIEDEGNVTATFGENPVTFSATTYYIKSSSTNSFAYEADSYDVTGLISEYNTAVSNANTAKTNAENADKLNAAEKTALDDAITTYGSIATPADPTKATKTVKDTYETAISTLTSATNTVNTSITAYANAKTYFEKVEPVLATTNAYTSDAYATNYSTPKAAYDAGTLSDDDAAALSYGDHRNGNMPAILLSSWAGTTLYINTWSTEAEGVAPARDFANPFFEYWVADGNNLGATTFTSTIGGLNANALYAVTLNARVKQRNGNRKVADGITMKVGEGDAVDLTQGLHIAMSRRFIDSYTAYGYTDGEGNLVTTITVAENSNISWLAFRDMNYAHVEGANALDEVIAEVTELNGHVPTNVYSTASAVVTSHTESYPTTDAEFETAISEIRTAAATAADYKEEYEAYLELKDYADVLVAVTNDNATANSTLATAISTAASNVNSVADVAALTSINTTLKAAMVTYAGVANPVGDGKKFNLTFMLGKVNFDDCIAWESPELNGFSGWATEQEGGNFQVMENDSKTSGDYHSFMEYWSWSAKANDQFNLYTTVELPEGTYTMSCYAFAVQQDGEAGKPTVNGLYFYANDTQGGVVNDNKLTQKSISFVNDTDQEVKIGLKPVSTGNTYNWMGIGYIELYKVPEQVFEVNESVTYDYSQEGAGNVELTRTIKAGINTLVLPFSMTQEEVEDAFGTDSKVYVIQSYDAESDNVTFAVQDGITANKPCLLQAKSAGTSYFFNARTVVAAASENPATDSYNGFKMVGSYAATSTIPHSDGNVTYYVLSGGKLYDVDTDITIRNTRAYFSLTAPSPAKSLNITLDGQASEVTAPEVVETEEPEVLFNMAGIQVGKDFKGFVINQKGEKRLQNK